MPTDMVSMTVSTGLGVSVVAGIISGLCYIFAQGIKYRKKNNKKHHRQHCNVCGDCVNPEKEPAKTVSCAKCGVLVCRQGCAYEKSLNYWICLGCSKTVQSWYKNILNVIQPSTNKFFSPFGTGMDKENLEPQRPLDNDEEKTQVRDFLERLVATMLGETVDDACISKMYHDERYETLVNRYHEELSDTITELGSALHISMSNLPVSGQSPCTAHAALKQLIQRLIQEAVHLPALKEAPNQEQVQNNEDNQQRTYEDLLATAILNKVIGTYQNGNTSSRTSSRMSSSSNIRDEKQYFFGGETLESKWKTTDLDTTSNSSMDDFIHSDSSLGSKKYVDRRTLTIKHNIEEVYQTDSENEEDDADYFRNTNNLLAENDSNWYLQKRQFKSTASPVPVPMLVPNPTDDAKVLIGDKEVNDTSDLSDVGSDYGETEPPSGVNSLLIESKTLIGGRSPLESIQDGWQPEDGSKDELKEQKTDITVDDDNVEDSSILSVYSNTEKEAEYTEKYASLPRTIEKPVSSSNISNLEVEEEIEEDEVDGSSFNGNYSKKEKEKWKNAVEMKNNPYTKESIEKRIQKRNSFNNLFGSDYYARQASKPSGSKSDTVEIEEILEAVAATVEEDILPEINDHTYPTDEPNEITASELTSDSDLSYINCYNIENAEISRISKDETENHDENANIIPATEETKPVFIKHSTPNSSQRFVEPFNQKMNRSQSESDLISEFDKPLTIVAKKRDNTLISKIYKQANVRTFALSNRDHLPVEDDIVPQNLRRQLSLEPKMLRSNTERQKHYSTSSIEDNTLEISLNDSLTNVMMTNEPVFPIIPVEHIETVKSVEKIVKSTDPIINSLQEQKVVSNLKNQFSKSCINLNESSAEKPVLKNKFNTVERKHSNEMQTNRVSVRELMKIFEGNQNNGKSADKPIYSLTARSLPKSTMEKLRN